MISAPHCLQTFFLCLHHYLLLWTSTAGVALDLSIARGTPSVAGGTVGPNLGTPNRMGEPGSEKPELSTHLLQLLLTAVLPLSRIPPTL